MPDRPIARLRVEPDMIPMLRDLFAECVELLDEKLKDLDRGGRIKVPWMNDPVSERVRLLYNERVMDAPDGGYHSLVAYRDELKKVYDALGAMQRDYDGVEDVNGEMIHTRLGPAPEPAP